MLHSGPFWASGVFSAPGGSQGRFCMRFSSLQEASWRRLGFLLVFGRWGCQNEGPGTSKNKVFEWKGLYFSEKSPLRKQSLKMVLWGRPRGGQKTPQDPQNAEIDKLFRSWRAPGGSNEFFWPPGGARDAARSDLGRHLGPTWRPDAPWRPPGPHFGPSAPPRGAFFTDFL